MVWVPSVSEEVVNAAAPAASAAVPITVAPSLNVTVPVGVPAPLLTVAVNVTACPTLLGLTEDARAVVVGTLLTAWLSARDVLGVKAASPPDVGMVL